jgi:hypothetical protein
VLTPIIVAVRMKPYSLGGLKSVMRRWDYMQRIAFVAMTLVITGLAPMHGQQAQEASGKKRTIVYFIRHPESNEGDATDPTHPLTAKGMERAKVFASTIREVSLTHVFSTHTTRARQTVAPAAAEHGLEVTQLPKPGSVLDGGIVSDATPSRLAVEPLVQALKRLPAGSRALVGVNADNIFAVMSGLGVPVARAGASCSPGSTCVPCVSNACYPVREYDRFWILITADADPVQLIALRYGTP